MEIINISIDEESMFGMGKTQFRFTDKKNMMFVVFNSLKTVQLTRTKVSNIQLGYPREPQTLGRDFLSLAIA